MTRCPVLIYVFRQSRPSLPYLAHRWSKPQRRAPTSPGTSYSYTNWGVCDIKPSWTQCRLLGPLYPSILNFLFQKLNWIFHRACVLAYTITKTQLAFSNYTGSQIFALRSRTPQLFTFLKKHLSNPMNQIHNQLSTSQHQSKIVWNMSKMGFSHRNRL